jgi:hypothetical protein
MMLETAPLAKAEEAGETSSTPVKHPQYKKRPPIRAPKKICGRSAVSNGRKLLLSNGSTAWGRRFADLCADHAEQLGGADNLTAAQIGLIRRASALECELELRENRLAAGEDVDLDQFARAASHCRRLWEVLGLRRVVKDSVPRLHAYVKTHKAKEERAREADDQCAQ